MEAVESRHNQQILYIWMIIAGGDIRRGMEQCDGRVDDWSAASGGNRLQFHLSHMG